MERWSKLTEALKASFSDDPSKLEKKLKHQEKIHQMSAIADLICSAQMMSSPDFSKHISATLDVLVRGCDDANSSVRLNANEFLNKMIKALIPVASTRILWHFFKEIKRNSSARCLRAALSRLGSLCHLIKPNKLRLYIGHLLPCIARVAKRDDEVVQESLTSTMMKLCPVFCPLMTEGELQSLTKSFLAKLSSTMTTTRRTAATSVGLLCEHAETPAKLIRLVIVNLLGLASSSDGQPPSVSALSGVLMCCRQVIPVLARVQLSDRDAEESTSSQHIHQLYALMLRCTGHPNPNVVTASLEALHVLLATPPVSLRGFLTTPCLEAPALPTDSLMNQLEASKTDEIATDDDDDDDDDDDETSAGILDDDVDAAVVVATEYDEQQTMTNISVADTDDELETTTTTATTDEPEEKKDDFPDPASPESEGTFETAWGEDVFSVHGQLTEEDLVPLVRCVRRLCSMFLLSGETGQILQQPRVRVSVKTLALKCVSASLSLFPSVFFLPVTPPPRRSHSSASDVPSRESVQFINDVLLYVFHSDPMLRGETASLAGRAIASFLQASKANYTQWESQLCEELKRESLPLSQLVQLLVSTLLDEPSVCKVACNACKSCLSALLASSDGYLGLAVFRSLLKVKSTSYWLVKVELAEALAMTDYRLVWFLQNQLSGLSKSSPVDLQNQAVTALLEFLHSDDGRVRQAASDAFINILPRLFYPELDGEREAMVQFASEEAGAFSLDFKDLPVDRFFHNQMHPFLHRKPSAVSDAIVMRNLSRIVAQLTAKITHLHDKHLMLGCCRAFARLAEAYPPHLFPEAWSLSGEAPRRTPVERKQPPSPVKSPSAQKTNSPKKMASSSGESGGKPGLSISFPLLFKLPVRKSAASVSPSLAQAKVKSGKVEDSPVGKSSGNVSSVAMETKPEKSADVTSRVYDGPFMALLGLMTSSSISLDLFAQQDMLVIFSKLIFSRARCSLSLPSNSLPAAGSWMSVQDRVLASIMEEYFVHLMRILRAVVYVVEKRDPQQQESKMREKLLGPLSQVGSGGLSPRKKTTKPPEREATEKSTSSKTEPDAAATTISKESQAVGWFPHIPLYCSLFDMLKGVYANHQTAIDDSEMTKFTAFVKSTLESLALLLEFAGLSDVSKMAEELIGYLRVCINHCPEAAFLCIEKLLNALFGANAAAESRRAESTVKVPQKRETLYSTCFSEPAARLEAVIQRIQSTKERYLQLQANPVNVKTSRRVRRESFLYAGRPDISPVAKYIGLFEPLVIRAMKMYTGSTGRKSLQKRVLALLIQLVRLRVNYAMLDSEQAFLSFVVGQLEKADEGYFKGDNDLLLHVFHFLTLLSNGRPQSSIVTTSRILQLCNGLMASLEDEDPSYILSALKPIVSDLFLARHQQSSRSQSARDLEAQQDVVLSVLTRLINHHEVALLIVTILNSSKSDAKTWRGRSEVVFEELRLKVDNYEYSITKQAHFLALNLLFASFAPSCFEPVDNVLRILVQKPPDDSKLLTWLSILVTVLQVAMAFLPGPAFSRQFQSHCELIESPWWDQNEAAKSSPKTLPRFLLGVVSVLIETFHEATAPIADLFYRLSYRFLIIMSLLFKGDLKQEVLNDSFCEGLLKDFSANLFPLLLHRPMLVVGWCAVTASIGYQSEWWDFLMTPELPSRPSSPSCEERASSAWPTVDCSKCRPMATKLVQCASLIFRSTILCGEGTASVAGDAVSSFIQNYSLDLCLLDGEPPVAMFLRSIGNNVTFVETFCKFTFALLKMKASLQLQHRVLVAMSHFGHSPQIAALALTALSNYASSCRIPSLLMASSKLAVRFAKALNPSKAGDTVSADARQIQNLKERYLFLTKKSKLFLKAFSDVVSQLKMSSGDDVAGELRIYSGSPDLLGPSNLEADYFHRVLNLCTSTEPSPCTCALLLHALPFRQCLTVMEHQNFSLGLLKECIRLGCQKTALLYQRRQDIAAVDAENEDTSFETAYFDENGIDHLFHAAQTVLLHKVSSCVSSSLSGKVSIVALAGALADYLHSLRQLPQLGSPPVSSLSYLADFSAHLLQWTAQEMQTCGSVVGEELFDCLSCSANCLENRSVFVEIAKKDHSAWSLKAVNSLFAILTTVLCDNLESTVKMTSSCEENLVDASSPEDSGDSPGEKIVHTAKKLSTLLEWCRSSSPVSVPLFLLRPLQSLITSVCRLPALESFARTPPVLWTDSLSAGGQPSVTAEDLVDEHVFREHVWRVLYLGWRNRQQFEESWVSFLAAISPPENGSDLPADVVMELYKVSRLSVQAITALLLQTTLVPVGGHPHIGYHSYVPRHRDLPFLGSRPGRRLQAIQSLVKDCYRSTARERKPNSPFHVKRNMERRIGARGFESGLVNITTLQVRVVTSDVSLSPDYTDSPDMVFPVARNGASVDSVDIKSCLRFLLDQYDSWLKMDNFPLVNVYETIRSAVILSDLFEEKWHFDWLLEHCQRLLSSWPNEDDNLLPYLVLGLCKAAAVQRNMSQVESVTKIILSSLNSSNLATEIMTLYGVLYLLESHSGVDFQALLGPLCEYLATHLTSDRPEAKVEKVQLVLWATAFFIMEHYQDDIKPLGFAQKVLKTAFECLRENSKVSLAIHRCVSDSIERLAVLFNLAKFDIDLASKTSAKSLASSNSAKAVSSLQLLLNCLYTGKTAERTVATSETTEEDLGGAGERSLVALEKITGALRRMHKGFPSDARLIAAVLPSLFEDFLPVQQTVTKVFGEFLSSQQPYPQYIAEVLFLVFGRLLVRQLGGVVRDWVVLSLSSFTQRSPFAMALWSLNCLFTSASSDKWLRAGFPRLLERVGSHGEEDEFHLYVAAKDFCLNKTLSSGQQESFLDAFTSSKQEVFRDLANFVGDLWLKEKRALKT